MDSPLVANVAWPAPFTDPLPSTVAPSRNCTVPVGPSGPPPVTVAVNVTLCPAVDGFTLDVTAVVVLALPTDCESAVEVDAAKLLSPPSAPVIEWPPASSEFSVSVAVVCPAAVARVPVPSNVAPSVNVIVPLGVPL